MRFLAFWAVILPLSLHAADQSTPAKAVFTISGLECGSCVYMVQHQLSQTPGIAEGEVLQGIEGYARVSYDPKLVSEHQIAHAVRETPGLHGTPYIATMKLRVPGFSQHAPQVKSLFEKWKPSIELVIWDAHAGELIVNFAELKKDAKGVLPRGWSLSQLDAGLKKLGLRYEILSPVTL